MKNKVLELLDSEVIPINDKDNELTAQRICDLFSVSNQRELLIDAAKKIYPTGDLKQQIKLIDKYLSNL